MIEDRIHSVLARMEREDAHERQEGVPAAQRSLACGPESGRLLFALVSASHDCRVLEIGASRGYSTIWLAAAARIGGGHVVSLERDPAKIEPWRRNIDEAGLSGVARLVEGDAFAALARLELGFQVVFLDAWKDDYEQFFELVRPLLVPGGVVVADNVHSNPVVATYAAARQADPSLVSVTLPIGNGLEVSALATH